MLGTAILVAGRRLGPRALLVGGVAPLAATAWAVWNAADVLNGRTITSRVSWVPGLGLEVDLRFDAFTLLMVGLVSGIGTLVFAYGWRYFGDGIRVTRLAGLLTLFAGAMLGLVLADNLLVLFIFWELTSLTSYLLIGNDDHDERARASALQALLITGLGGLVMLAGFVIIGQQAGTYQITALLADPPTGGPMATALVLVLIGAFTKSAQYPFHSWLPKAMVAPTPVSAYLHSAAMVKAGVYVVALFAPAFASVGIWRPLVVTVGLVTMLSGGLRALRPYDLKQILAFGTVSQLGFLMVLFGLGRPDATAAGCALLISHGAFKAALFMVVGIIDHQAHTRDVRRLPLLGVGWTTTKVVGVVSAASMAAVPPLAGFVAKDSAYEALLHGGAGDRWVLVGIVAGSVLTVAYSLRIMAGLLRPSLVAGEPSGKDASKRDAHSVLPPSPWFVLPAALLAMVTVVLGVLPAGRLVREAAAVLDPRSDSYLKLWHGFTTALALSMVTLFAGLVLFLIRRRVERAQARFAPRYSADHGYNDSVRGVLRTAEVVTGIAQPGSLPVYAAVILVTAAVVPLSGLVLGPFWPGWPDLVGASAYIPVAALLIGGAVAATIATRRFTAALLLGSVGYGMALLFIVHGAPDLALTQFAIETLSIVLFLLVLRRLPDHFERRAPAISQVPRLLVSAAFGVFVLIMGLASAGARRMPPVSDAMVEDALPKGGGRNVVNVILVDIRGLDTLGEITVLVVAGLGATALARAARRQSASDTGVS